VSRFQREAEVLASLSHPNIASIYDLAQAGQTRYLGFLVNISTDEGMTSPITLIYNWKPKP
jgi:serine/threonine protein kinase